MMPSIRRAARLLDPIGVRRVRRLRAALAVGVLVVGLRQQADQAFAGGRPIGRYSGKTLSPNAFCAAASASCVVRPGVVELGDHHGAGHADLAAFLPQRLGRLVDALVGGDHEQRAVRGPQPGPQLADEVGVSGGVDQVDLDAVVRQRRHGDADRSLLADLGVVEVADRACRRRPSPVGTTHRRRPAAPRPGWSCRRPTARPGPRCERRPDRPRWERLPRPGKHSLCPP